MLTLYLLHNVQQRSGEFAPRPKYFLLLTMKTLSWGPQLQFEHERDRYNLFLCAAHARHNVNCLVKYQIMKELMSYLSETELAKSDTWNSRESVCRLTLKLA
jgi:hypothetical protein